MVPTSHISSAHLACGASHEISGKGRWKQVKGMEMMAIAMSTKTLVFSFNSLQRWFCISFWASGIREGFFTLVKLKLELIDHHNLVFCLLCCSNRPCLPWFQALTSNKFIKNWSLQEREETCTFWNNIYAERWNVLWEHCEFICKLFMLRTWF